MKLLLIVAAAWLAAGLHAQAALEPGTVLITGSSRGLGLEFARQYAARGWTVIATARNPDEAVELSELAEAGRVTVERLDVLDRAAIAALATRYEGTPIDLLINNAGIGGDPALQSLGSFDYAFSKKRWPSTFTARSRCPRRSCRTSGTANRGRSFRSLAAGECSHCHGRQGRTSIARAKLR
jgi:hypothetical protein